MGASSVTVNMNAAINKAMHRPITKNGEYTLYTKFNDSSSAESAQMTEAEKDAEFMQKSKVNFNSPTNIRRVFVTNKKVYVHYYCPYIVNNAPTGKYTSEVELVPVPKNKGTSIYEIAESMTMFNEYNANFKSGMGRAASTIFAEEGRSIYKVSGTMVNILSSNYACNNIEELYFDWTLLLSNDLEAYLPDSHRITARRDILNNWVNSNGFRKNYDNFMIDLICQILNLRSKEEVIKKFPRLKAVGIISNLEAVMSNSAVINSQGLLKTKNDTKTWLESNAELIQRSNSIVQISIIDQSSKPNYNFKVKDQQYKFDHDYLKDYVEKYKKAFENIIRTGNAEGVKEEPKEETSGEIDETLEALITELRETEKKRGIQNYAMAILRIAYCDMSADEKKKAVNSVSGENKQLLSKAIL